MVELIDIVERGVHLAGVAERTDLVRRLEQTRQRLEDPTTRVLVVGEVKQGKSKLINALVNAPVCPVGDDIATSVPTVVRYGEVPSAHVVHAIEGGREPGRDSTAELEVVELDQISAHVSESGNPGNERNLSSAEVFLPRTLLADGLTLVDSPGVGGTGSAHALATLSALAGADAMLFVSDSSQEFTEPELQFLRQAYRVCPNVACVLSKTDLYPHWRQIAEIDRKHLDRVSADIPIFAVSSDLRLHAASLEDAELNAESGFPALVRYLRRDVVGASERLQRRSVVHDVTSVTEHLALALQSELTGLTHPEQTPKIIAEMEAAKSRSDDLRRRSARWQVTLNDGVSDLISDMEYDLRDRMRTIQREAEKAIDEADPGPAWEELVDWLEQRAEAAASDTFVWTNERAQWLSQQVAENFAEYDVRLPQLPAEEIEDLLDPVEFDLPLDRTTSGPVEKVLIGMRGSYGGVLMIGLVTGILGMALINPISIAAGVLIGTKVYKDDKAARLKRRQAEAKAIVRRQIEEVIFQVGKHLKDRMRLVQRATRDHFIDIADEYRRSLGDSITALQLAASTYDTENDDRVAELKQQFARVDGLRKVAQAAGQDPPRQVAA